MNVSSPVDLKRMTTTAPDCVIWVGAVTSGGYGNMWLAGKWNSPHVFLWVEANGPIPQGMQVDHICHDPESCPGGPRCPHRRCVNLSHLRLTRPVENSAPDRRAAPARTHCKRGHAWVPSNIYEWRGTKSCRPCRQISQKAYEVRTAR